MKTSNHPTSRRSLRTITAGAATILAGLSLAAEAGAATRGAATCEFDPLTATATIAAGNPKTIDVGIVRSGDEITVFDANSSTGSQINCTGGTPTVTNTDEIVVDATIAVREQNVVVDLSGGPFAPGLTDEADGSSEIEFDVTIMQKGRYPDAYLQIVGSDEADEITAGALGNDTGFNLNAGESAPDIDLTLHQRLDTRPTSQVKLIGEMGNGDDSFDAGGPAPFAAPIDLGYGEIRWNGGDGNDTLTGGLSSDRLEGAEGDDSLAGGAGNDDLRGGKGSDSLSALAGNNSIGGGNGADTISTGPGKDYISAGKGGDTIEAGDGDDRIFGSNGRDEILAGGGDDKAYGGSGVDTIEGGAGNDRIDGDSGSDSILGGDGDDRIDGDRGSDTIDAGPGNDRADGDNGADQVLGADGNDKLRGGQGPDELDGGDGDDNLRGDGGWGRGAVDVLIGGAGEDKLNGEEGDDVIDAVDGFADTIRCELGDEVDADKKDKLKGDCAS